jgi:hypothetical protein
MHKGLSGHTCSKHTTSIPAKWAALMVASRCSVSKCAGTVITALSTCSCRYPSARCFSTCKQTSSFLVSSSLSAHIRSRLFNIHYQKSKRSYVFSWIQDKLGKGTTVSERLIPGAMMDVSFQAHYAPVLTTIKLAGVCIETGKISQRLIRTQANDKLMMPFADELFFM